MIELRGVRFAYRAAAHEPPVLRDVDLTIGPGLTLLLGPNGCGKSTLLKVAAGVEHPDAGRVTVGGHDLWRAEVPARLTLAYVPEAPDLSPYATIAESIDLVCALRREPRARAVGVIAEAGLTRAEASRSVRELSMGQRRRALLAAAWVGSPDHLLLDEPLEAMDRGIRDRLLAWIARRSSEGATVVVISHQIEPFVAGATHALTLRDGRIEQHTELPRGSDRLALLECLAR